MDQHLVREVSKHQSSSKFISVIVQCPPLTVPIDGMISCSLINSPVFSYEDTCSFTCNTGYELTGSSETRTCQSNETWSSSDVFCSRGNV